MLYISTAILVILKLPNYLFYLILSSNALHEFPQEMLTFYLVKHVVLQPP